LYIEESVRRGRDGKGSIGIGLKKGKRKRTEGNSKKISNKLCGTEINFYFCSPPKGKPKRGRTLKAVA
jgi:hypothetical protein